MRTSRLLPGKERGRFFKISRSRSSGAFSFFSRRFSAARAPSLRGGPGVDVLFSPGMPVTWAQIEVDPPAARQEEPRVDLDSFDAL